jgi:hypothetical protein
MSRTIGEGIAMVKAMEQYERIVRINTWFRFEAGFYGMNTTVAPIRKAVMHKLLGDGPLTVTVGAHQGFDWKLGIWVGKVNQPEEKVPEHFDYDFWLGPAPVKPYTRHRTHGSFRGYWDYDGGGLGDMGQHYLDPVQYILGKDEESPVEVFIDADPQDQDAVGTWRRIEFTYADGTKIILDGKGDDKSPYIKGSEGSILRGFKSDVNGFDEKLKSLPDPEPQLTDFHQAVRERKKFALNEKNAFRSASIVNLGTIAHRSNKSFKYDAKTFTIDEPEANKLIHQEMRGPWKV